MNKILSILFVFLAIWVCKLSYDFNDENLDIAHSIVAENAFLYGLDEYSSEQNKRIVNSKKRFVPTEYHKIKREILSGKSDAKNIEKKISKLDNQNLCMPLYALAAKAFKQSDKQISDKLIFFANMSLFGINAKLYELQLLEAIDCFADIDDKTAQETAVSAILKLPYSHDKSLLLYKLVSKKYAVEKFKRLYKTDKNKYKSYHWTTWRSRYFNTKPVPQKELERSFVYSAIEFSMTWELKEHWHDYKMPLLAYVCYLNKDEKGYAYNKEKSLSWSQLQYMQAGYFQYVEYASKIFCLTQDYDSAIKLLKTLPDGHKKNLVLKRLARYLTSTKQGLETTQKSNLF